jgi:hypothetical protein
MIKFFSGVVARDHKLMGECPPNEHVAVISQGAHLLLVAGISAIIWVGFGFLFLSPWSAPALGIIAFCLTVLIEQSISIPEVEPAGFLKDPAARNFKTKATKFGGRASLAVVFSLVTSLVAGLILHWQTIFHTVEDARRDKNWHVDEQFDQEVHTVKFQLLGIVLKRVDELHVGIDRDRASLDEASGKVADAANRSAIAADQMKKEANGGDGYDRGKKAVWKQRRDEKLVADNDLAKAQAQVGMLQPRLDAMLKELPQAEERLAAAEAQPAVRKRLEQVEAERMEAHEKPGVDGMMAVMALEKVFDDPKTGGTARWFHYLMMAVLLAVELSYVIRVIFYAPASVYNAKVMKTTKLMVEKEAADYQRERAAFWTSTTTSPGLSG